MAVVMTVHTILKIPSADQRRVLEEVVALSDRVVGMSELGAEFLQSIYHVPTIPVHSAFSPGAATCGAP
jgi:hypothetical protein